MTVRALERRIAALEKALRPFADEANAWHESVADNYRPGLTEPKQKFAYAKAYFTIGHCRRAARLLALGESADKAKE